MGEAVGEWVGKHEGKRVGELVDERVDKEEGNTVIGLLGTCVSFFAGGLEGVIKVGKVVGQDVGKDMGELVGGVVGWFCKEYGRVGGMG